MIFALLRAPCESGLLRVFSGVGGVLGYLILAAIIGLLDALGIYVFTPWFLAGLLIAAVTASLILIVVMVKGRVASRGGFGLPQQGGPVLFFLAGSILILIAHSLYQATFNPVSSWDALGMWVNWADWFLRFDLDIQDLRGFGSRVDHGAFAWQHPRHPPTVYYISAFTGYVLKDADLFRGWLVPWSVLWACGLAIIWGFVRYVSGCRILGTLAALAFCSLPLIENHTILVGYADLWTATVTLVSSALLALALFQRRTSLLVLGVLVALVPLGIKNTGLLYLMSLLIPLVIVVGLENNSRLVLILLAACGVGILWLVASGFDVELAGQRYSVAWGSPIQVTFGSRTMDFVAYPISGILHNQLWAIFVNGSFNVVAVLGVVLAVMFCRGQHQMPLHARLAVHYLLMCSFMMLLLFMVPQLATSYSANFAVPGSDLGNSRFIMGFGAPLLLSLGFVPTMLSERY